MTQQNQNPNPTSKVDDDEIDLIALAKTVWEGRKSILKITLIFMTIGLFVAIFSEKEYTASTTFVAQTSDSKIGGNLGGLAAMAGINIGGTSSSSVVSPKLFRYIIENISFQKELLATPLTIEGRSDKITYKEYYSNVYTPSLLGYIKKFTLGLPGLIIKAIKGNSISSGFKPVDSHLIRITNQENKLIKKLSNQLELEVNDNDGYVILMAKMPTAVASAELTLKAQQLLQRYVIDFKIQKSREQLEYIKERYLVTEEKFKNVQHRLASYQDRNKFVSTAIGNTKLETIQDEYTLVYGVYTELSKQLEAQYLQVTEDTPVFTVLKPVTIPLDKSKPKRIFILFVWTFLGGVIGIGIIFGKNFLKSRDNRIWE